MNKIIKDNQKGFTLIEILIAITVFAIGILGVAAMQLGAIKGNSYSSHLTEATTLAQNKMEELMMLDYNDPNDLLKDGHENGVKNGATGLRYPLPPLPKPPIPNPVSYPPDYSPQAPSGIYTISYNIADNVGHVPATNTKTIGIVVTWVENGVTKQVAIQSVKAQM